LTPEEKRRRFENWQREQVWQQQADKSALGQGLNALDTLNTLGYAVGGLIESGSTVTENPLDMSKWKFYGYQWKISAAESLGVVQENTDAFSGRWWAGMAVDILTDPTTYLTLGTGSATKLTSVGGTKVALSSVGKKELAKFIAKYGKESGSLEFVHHIEQSSAFANKVKAFEGIGLRTPGWMGSFLGGRETELISKGTLSDLGRMPGELWDSSLRSLALSGEPKLASRLKDIGEWPGRTGQVLKTKLENKASLWANDLAWLTDKEYGLEGFRKALKTYDAALDVWKATQTVLFPAYHAMNVLGAAWNNFLVDISLSSYAKGFRTVRNKGGQIAYTSDLGDKLTAQQLYREMNAQGILKQPGMMDITGETFSDRTRKVWSNLPTTKAVRKEEDFIRASLYIDRRLKGDTPKAAKEWVSDTQFDYSRAAYSDFENNVMRRIIPFYVYEKNNLLLQTEMLLRQPGKYATFSKAQDYASGNETLPYWAWNTMPLGVDENGKFMYLNTPLNSLGIYGDPYYLYRKDYLGQEVGSESSYAWNILSPFLPKLLYEQTVRNQDGKMVNSFTGQPYESDYGPVANLILGRAGRAYETAKDPSKTTEEKTASLLLGVNTAFTSSELSDMERFRESAPGYMNASQKIAIAKRSNWQSVVSGETTGLVITDIQQVGPDGNPVTMDQVLLTQDEHLEQERALRAELSLPERIFVQNEQWSQISEEHFARKKIIEEMQLDRWAHPINDAQKEQKKYNLRKRTNLRYIDIEMRKLQVAINRLEKFRRGEMSKGKAWDIRNAKVTEIVLSKYYAKLDELKALRAEEEGKVFDLPEQITELEKFRPMDIGNYAGLAVKHGSGPELLHPGNIINQVRLPDLAEEYQIAVGDIKKGETILDSLSDYEEQLEEVRQMTRDMLDDYLSRGLEN
jgi:hypothetical protein